MENKTSAIKSCKKAFILLLTFIFVSFFRVSEASAELCPPVGRSAASGYDIDFEKIVQIGKLCSCNGCSQGSYTASENDPYIAMGPPPSACGDYRDDSEGVLNGLNCIILPNGKILINSNAGDLQSAEQKAAAAKAIEKCQKEMQGHYDKIASDAAKAALAKQLQGALSTLSKNVTEFRRMSEDDPPTICGYPASEKGYKVFYTKMVSVCWFCDPFNYLLALSNEVARNTFDRVKEGALSLLSVLLALWLVYHIMTNATILYGKDQGELYTKLGMGLVRAAVAAALIKMGVEVWQFVVTPIVSTTFNYTSNAMLRGGGNPTQMAYGGGSAFEAMKVALLGTGCEPGQIGEAGLLRTINTKLMEVITVGYLMVTGAAKHGNSNYCLPVQYFNVFMAGIPIVVLGVALLFIVPLKLLDPVFRIGLVLVLLPVFILTWVFPSTRNYTIKGFNMFLHGFITILVMGILISVLIRMVETAMGLGSITQMLPVVDEFPFEDVRTKLSLSGTSFFTVIAYMLIAYKAVGTAGEIANFLTDVTFGGDSTIGLQKAAKTGAGLVGMAGLATGSFVARNVTGGVLKLTGHDSQSVADRKLNRFEQGGTQDLQGQGRNPSSGRQEYAYEQSQENQHGQQSQRGIATGEYSSNIMDEERQTLQQSLNHATAERKQAELNLKKATKAREDDALKLSEAELFSGKRKDSLRDENARLELSEKKLEEAREEYNKAALKERQLRDGLNKEAGQDGQVQDEHGALGSSAQGRDSYDVNKVELTNSPAFKEMSINQKAGYIRSKQGLLITFADFVMGHVRKFAEGEDYHRYL